MRHETVGVVCEGPYLARNFGVVCEAHVHKTVGRHLPNRLAVIDQLKPLRVALTLTTLSMLESLGNHFGNTIGKLLWIFLGLFHGAAVASDPYVTAKARRA